MSDLQDHWTLAHNAFQTGARKRATTHLQTAIHSPTPPLFRTILQINAHALTQTPSPLYPTTPSTSPLPVRLLTLEAALISAYNSSLSQFHSPNFSTQTLDRVLKTIPSLLSVAYSTSLPPSTDSWVQCLTLVDSIRLSPDIFLRLPSNASTSLLRLLHAAAASFELRSALALKSTSVEIAHQAASTAAAIRALAALELTRPKPVDFTPPSSPPAEHSSHTTPSKTLDAHATRPTLLLALNAAKLNKLTEALEHVLPPAREALDANEVDTHLPCAYLAAALLIRKGGDEQLATQLLESCVSRGYRSVDSLALLARMKEGEAAIGAWQQVVGIDFRRPAALWLAAAEMGKEGKYTEQEQLLRCLDELIQEGGQVDKAGVKLAPNEEVNERRVALARGSALCGMEEWESAQQVLEGVEGGDVLRGWAKLGGGEVEASMDETGNMVQGVDGVCGRLVRAEAMLRLERVKEAQQEVMDALRWVEEEGVIRAVCFHNLGVLKWCMGEMADEYFAAAQTGFAKAGERRLEVEATVGRVLCMWASGRRSDAAAHWVAKREQRTVQTWTSGKTVDVVATRTSEEALNKLDAVCTRVCKMEEARRRLNETIRKLELEM